MVLAVFDGQGAFSTPLGRIGGACCQVPQGHWWPMTPPGDSSASMSSLCDNVCHPELNWPGPRAQTWSLCRGEILCGEPFPGSLETTRGLEFLFLFLFGLLIPPASGFSTFLEPERTADGQHGPKTATLLVTDDSQVLTLCWPQMHL